MVSKGRLRSIVSLQTQLSNTVPPGSPFCHDQSSGTPTCSLFVGPPFPSYLEGSRASTCSQKDIWVAELPHMTSEETNVIFCRVGSLLSDTRLCKRFGAAQPSLTTMCLSGDLGNKNESKKVGLCNVTPVELVAVEVDGPPYLSRQPSS
ncbi:Protein transport protein SEC9 [Fusarium oxysporum f. sp. albedinis]|nr:Protein transport protein SEC9 [Fusarium oxysporum f. sp. albedinis]